jgi:phospholipid/cholesterol/gamma-HCH transport system substrate-binding protein
MAENRTEILVGGAVLAVAVGFLVYLLNSTGLGGGNSDRYDLSAAFRSAQGVAVGTDVRLAGVKVGTVTGVDLDPQSFRAVTTMSLQSNVDIPDDSSVVISTEGLLGGTFVEILPGGSPFNLAAGDEIIDTQSSVSLVNLLLKFVTAD